MCNVSVLSIYSDGLAFSNIICKNASSAEKEWDAIVAPLMDVFGDEFMDESDTDYCIEDIQLDDFDSYESLIEAFNKAGISPDAFSHCNDAEEVKALIGRLLK